MDERVVVKATAVTKDFPNGASVLHVLKGLDLTVSAGEIVAIVGPSGSGKTTFLSLLGGLERPTSGSIEIGGREITHLKEDALAKVRNEGVGFVFQFFNLLPTLTALENVELPMHFHRQFRAHAHARARELLKQVGLEAVRNKLPGQLSGGEQQRVAIARALANRPSLILADEPTGNLDSENAHQVMQLLKDLCEIHGVASVVATHDPAAVFCARRVLYLRDGQWVNEPPLVTALAGT